MCVNSNILYIIQVRLPCILGLGEANKKKTPSPPNFLCNEYHSYYSTMHTASGCGEIER